MAKSSAKENLCTWEQDIAFRIVELYVKELTERRDKKFLDLNGLIESYLYALGRLKVDQHRMENIVEEIKKSENEVRPSKGSNEGFKEAVGDKKLSAGLLKALEGM